MKRTSRQPEKRSIAMRTADITHTIDTEASTAMRGGLWTNAFCTVVFAVHTPNTDPADFFQPERLNDI